MRALLHNVVCLTVKGAVCDSSSPVSPQARAAEGAGSFGLLARQDLAAAPPVAAVLEAPALFALMRHLLQVVRKLSQPVYI